MTLYELNGQRYAVIKDELYVRLEPTESGRVTESPDEDRAEPSARKTAKPKRKRKAGFGWKAVQTQIQQHRERKARVSLSPETKEAILEEIRGGLGLADTCKKYGISVATYYRFKDEAMSKPVQEAKPG